MIRIKNNPNLRMKPGNRFSAIFIILGVLGVSSTLAEGALVDTHGQARVTDSNALRAQGQHSPPPKDGVLWLALPVGIHTASTASERGRASTLSSAEALHPALPVEGATRAPRIDSKRTQEVLKKEAYYHFFLSDYMTSATRLKLIEAEEIAQNETTVLNEVRLLLGSLYMAWGMHQPATAIFNELITAYPPGIDRNRVLLLIERLQYNRSFHEATVKTYNLLTSDEKFPSMDQASYMAGMSHYALGSFQKGIQAMETIPKSSAYYPFAQLALAKSYFQSKNYTDSFYLLKDLSELNHRKEPFLEAISEKGRLTLGLFLVEGDQFKEARSVLASIPKESPFHPDALFGLGWAHFNSGRYLQAILIFEDLIRMVPEHPYALEALTTIGHCYNRLEAYPAAIKNYDEALAGYTQEEQAIDKSRELIQDRVQLAALLRTSETIQNSPLAKLLDDDERILFWVRQYEELLSLESYLNQKINDMGVFNVMVDHRQEVFRGYFPTLRRFLKKNPVKDLQEKGHLLQNRLEQATQKEDIGALATTEEAKVLAELNRAQERSVLLKQIIKARVDHLPNLSELKDQWQAADRWLALLRNEILWKITTEVPARHDDLNRRMKKLRKDLEALGVQQAKFVSSVPSLEKEIHQFRVRIEEIQPVLREKRARTVKLRESLLQPLQVLLLKALNNRLGYIVKLAAKARLSQIQILDLKRKS